MMARYYFDICDNDDCFQDNEGIELSDAETITREATAALLEIARDQSNARVQSQLSVQVRNEMGIPIVRVVVSIGAQMLDTDYANRRRH